MHETHVIDGLLLEAKAETAMQDRQIKGRAIASVHRDQPKAGRTGSAGQVRQSEIPLTL